MDYKDDEILSRTIRDITSDCGKIKITLEISCRHYNYIVNLHVDQSSMPNLNITSWSQIEKFITSVDNVNPKKETDSTPGQQPIVKEEKELRAEESKEVEKYSGEIVAMELSTLSPEMDRNLDPSAYDVTGYKFANFFIPSSGISGDLTSLSFSLSKDVDISEKYTLCNDVKVILTLSMPYKRALVYNMDRDGRLSSMDDITSGVKYCTNIAKAVGIQFIGNPIAVKNALLIYQLGKGLIKSQYDNKTLYELQQETYEPSAGERSASGGRCGKGIYFFTDYDSTVNYWSNNTPNDHKQAPIITKKLSHGRGLGFNCGDYKGYTVKDQIEERKEKLHDWFRKNLCLEESTKTTESGFCIYSSIQTELTCFFDNFFK